MSPQSAELLVNEVVPRLKNTIPHSVRCVASEDAEELLQDATAMAARLLHQAEANGKSVSPGNVCFYTTLHSRSGRRFHSASRTDAMGSRTQIAGHSRVSSFDDPIASDNLSDEPTTLGDVLASDAEDPSETAARNLDWSGLIATLDERALSVLRCMAGEIRLQELASHHGVGRSTVQGWRNQLTVLVRAFLGPDVLLQIQQTPRWQQHLCAIREQLACRIDRRMAA